MGEPRASGPTPAERPRARTGLWLLLVLLATFAAHAPSLANGFTQDDVYLVQVGANPQRANAMVATWQGIPAYFGAHYGASQWAGGSGYRPVTVLSYAATYALFGDRLVSEAFPHHLGNVLLHVLGAWLVFRLLGTLRCAPPAALAGAAVFGLHALRTEAVAGVVGRAELLAFCGGAAAVLAWSAGGRRRWLTGPLLFVAFCSKESALAWVPFLPLFAFAAGRPLRGATVSALVHALAPLALYLALRQHALAAAAAAPIPWVANPLAEAPTAARLANAVLLWVRGLWQTLVPLDLNSDYGPHTLQLAGGFCEARVLLSLALLVALVAVGCAVARRQPLVFLATACFFGFSFLTSNAPFATGAVYGERLWYTPALAVSFLAAAAVGRWPRSLWIVLAWLVASAALTVARTRVWRDDLTLFATDARRNPQSVRLHVAYSKTLLDQDPANGPAALVPLRRALELEPELATTWNDLGVLLIREAQRPHTRPEERAALLQQAEAALRRGLTAKRPLPASESWRTQAVLGGLCLRTGKLDEAESLLLAAVQAMPAHVPAWRDLAELAEAWFAAGSAARARSLLERLARSPVAPRDVREAAGRRLQTGR